MEPLRVVPGFEPANDDLEFPAKMEERGFVHVDETITERGPIGLH
jgi:hypothetical protein